MANQVLDRLFIFLLILYQVPQYSYSTGSETESVEDDATHAYDNMTAMELYNVIKSHLTQFSRAKLSWLNKLFTKVVTPEEFLRALEIFDTFHRRLISITPETGTLLIKAACRAGEPEKALALLKVFSNSFFKRCYLIKSIRQLTEFVFGLH